MNKNKIIFSIIGVILLGLIFLLVANLNSSGTGEVKKTAAGDFKIWILHDSVGDFGNFIAGFKEAYPSYSTKNIIVESFSDEQTYTNALSSAIFEGTAPDIFMINNSESSVFENQIRAIDPATISPNDFRLRFKPVFGEDLIITDPDDASSEFLKGIPAGYEALGIFYNRKYFLRPSELKTWSAFTKEINNISEKYSSVVPLAIGNGTGVSRASEIISALIVLEGTDSLVTTDNTKSRQVLGLYNGFGQKNGDNRYNILSAPFVDDKDIDFFAQGDVAAMIGYPRDLFSIDKIGYQKSFLFASPFPKYAGTEERTSVNYNYFSMNKNTIHDDLALTFLSYVASPQGQQLYVDTFPYYLSPEVDVALGMAEKKMLAGYNVVYKNFVNEDATLVSYDVGNKNMYDAKLPAILDMQSGYDKSFNELASYITCSSTKQKTLLNLSSPCK